MELDSEEGIRRAARGQLDHGGVVTFVLGIASCTVARRMRQFGATPLTDFPIVNTSTVTNNA